MHFAHIRRHLGFSYLEVSGDEAAALSGFSRLAPV
jgi:hypothetical protein